MAITLLKSISQYANSHAPVILIIIQIINVSVIVFIFCKIWDHFKTCAEDAFKKWQNGQPPKEGTTTITITTIEPIIKRPKNDKIIVIDPENKVNQKLLPP